MTPPLAPVHLRGVAKRYGRSGPLVLQSVDLTAPAGALVHVHGANGGGKSTLLRIIAGISAPTRGTVSGRPRSVGFVPERFPATVRFTPRRYLQHLTSIRGTDAEAAVALLSRLGGNPWLDEPMTDLSKGSCQKVALALALAGRPGLIVLDEAWTGLDTQAQAVLTGEVQAAVAAGSIVVFTEHAQRSTAVRPTLRWLVAGSAVTVEAAPVEAAPRDAWTAGARMAVVLYGGFGGPALAQLPGISRCVETARVLRLDVDAPNCDHLLAEALRTGWSVHDVRAAEVP